MYIYMQLFTKYHPSIAPVDYLNMIRVYWYSGDMIGGLDYIYAAEAAGIDFLNHTEAGQLEYIPQYKRKTSTPTTTTTTDATATTTSNSTTTSNNTSQVASTEDTSSFLKERTSSRKSNSIIGRKIQADFVTFFHGKGLRQLDQFYYLLLDLVATGHKIPRVLLNGLIMSGGRLGQVCIV